MHSLQYTWLQLGNRIQIEPNFSPKQTLQVWLDFSNTNFSDALWYSFNTSKRSPLNWLSDTALQSRIVVAFDAVLITGAGDLTSETLHESLAGFPKEYAHDKSKICWISRCFRASDWRNWTHSYNTTWPLTSFSHFWSNFLQSFESWKRVNIN